MYEFKEVINMLATIAFFTYFYYLVRKGKCHRIPEIWLYGVLLITISNISTVLEGFWLPAFYNFIEHLSFAAACIMFLIGSAILKTNVNS